MCGWKGNLSRSFGSAAWMMEGCIWLRGLMCFRTDGWGSSVATLLVLVLVCRMDDSLSEVAAFFALEEFPNSDDRENFSLPLVSFMTSDDWFRFLDFELTLA